MPCEVSNILGHTLKVFQSFAGVLFIVCGWEKLFEIFLADSGIVPEVL
jgi:hypothetical protein